MKLVRKSLMVTLVFLVGCAVGGGASRFVVPPAQAKDIQRWDYLCFEEWGAKDIMPKAKAAGAEGWEMVMADSLQGRQSICFKRPL
jgi:hypothetical protein